MMCFSSFFAKLQQKMKKNTSWKFMDELSITFQLSVSAAGEFSHRLIYSLYLQFVCGWDERRTEVQQADRFCFYSLPKIKVQAGPHLFLHIMHSEQKIFNQCIMAVGNYRQHWTSALVFLNSRSRYSLATAELISLLFL